MNAHTPAPWTMGGLGRSIYIYGPINELSEAHPVCALHMSREWTMEQMKANARIIEQAPELLAFGQWAMSQLESYSGTSENQWAQYREYKNGLIAISKASGATP